MESKVIKINMLNYDFNTDLFEIKWEECQGFSCPSLSTDGSCEEGMDYNDEVSRILESVKPKEIKKRRCVKTPKQIEVLNTAIDCSSGWDNLKAKVP